MTHSIAFGGFATYRNMTWDTALVQKEKKKDIWGYSNRIHLQCIEQSKCNISEDVQL